MSILILPVLILNSFNIKFFLKFKSVIVHNTWWTARSVYMKNNTWFLTQGGMVKTLLAERFDSIFCQPIVCDTHTLRWWRGLLQWHRAATRVPKSKPKTKGGTGGEETEELWGQGRLHECCTFWIVKFNFGHYIFVNLLVVYLAVFLIALVSISITMDYIIWYNFLHKWLNKISLVHSLTMANAIILNGVELEQIFK